MSGEGSMSIPTNLSVASYFATMEWFRSHFAKVAEAPSFRVLSVENGSPEYDADIVRQLVPKVADFRYTVLNASKAYSTMATKHADVMPVIEFVTSPVDTFDPEDKYDFVHSCLWRDQFERDDGGTTGEPRKPSLESRLLRLCKPSGTLVTFVYGSDGVFRLRTLLRQKIPVESSLLKREALLSADAVQSALLAAGASTVIREVIDSQVDLRDCVGDVLSPIGVRTLGTLLKWDVEDLARRQPTLLEEIIDAMVDMSLNPIKVSLSCPVYAPVVAVLATPRGSVSPMLPALSPSSSVSLNSSSVHSSPADTDRQPLLELFRSSPNPLARRTDEEVFYPHGARGGFFNKGMQLWLARREQLNSASPARRPQQPPLTPKEAKSLVSDLAAQQDQRTFSLPRPLRLSDVIKCYNLIWDMEEGYGD